MVGEGLAGQWQMLSVKYNPPLSLHGGEGALRVLQKLWNNGETMQGRPCGLGFLFLYSLLQGQVRCKVVSGGMSDWWWGDSFASWGGGYQSNQSSDSHRLALLLAQLYVDRRSKSVPASVINVLARNRQLSVRMPEFKDTRKNKYVHLLASFILQVPVH